MTNIFEQDDDGTGRKTIAVHGTGDGFLLLSRWNWPEVEIHQEIVYFASIDQARKLAETILAHIGRLNLQMFNDGALESDSTPSQNNSV